MAGPGASASPCALSSPTGCASAQLTRATATAVANHTYGGRRSAFDCPFDWSAHQSDCGAIPYPQLAGTEKLMSR